MKRCELLKAEFKNQMKLLGLSKEDREIRNIENKIWKIILDDYFQNKNHRILKLNEYSVWFSKFKIKLREIQANGTVCEKRIKILTDITETLYMDVKRDKSFFRKWKYKNWWFWKHKSKLFWWWSYRRINKFYRFTKTTFNKWI